MKTPGCRTRWDASVAYAKFQVIPETMAEGWGYGAVTAYEGDGVGCLEGDGFVEAPDGSRAGLDWIVRKRPGRVRQVAAPNDIQWGVYEAVFTRPVFTTADLVREFRGILPVLKRKFWRLTIPPEPVADAQCYPRGEYGWPVVPLSHFRRRTAFWFRYLSENQGIFVVDSTGRELAMTDRNLVDHETARCISSLRKGTNKR